MGAETDAKRQRIKKAVRLYYGENMTQEEIADEMGYSRETINGYLNNEVAEEFKAPLSSQESYEVQKAFEEKFDSLEAKAEQLLEEAMMAGEFSDRVKALRELRQTYGDVAEFAEKIGALETEPEEHEVHHRNVPDVQFIIDGDEEDDSDG